METSLEFSNRKQYAHTIHVLHCVHLTGSFHYHTFSHDSKSRYRSDIKNKSRTLFDTRLSEMLSFSIYCCNARKIPAGRFYHCLINEMQVSITKWPGENVRVNCPMDYVLVGRFDRIKCDGLSVKFGLFVMGIDWV